VQGGNAKAKKPKVTTTAKKSKVEREPSAPWEEGRVATEDELFMWGCMKGKELEVKEDALLLWCSA
jgi:hypothetical protein